MPFTSIQNPFGVNAPQGNVNYSDKMVIEIAGDPYGNVQPIASVTAANPGVWTTSGAHGFISGQQIVLGYVAGLTPNNTSTANIMTGAANNALVNGVYTVTVLSSTTFSVPVNTTGGTLTQAGAAAQGFVVGQAAALQGWNGTASSNTATSAFETVGLTPITTSNFGGIGIIDGIVAPGNSTQLPTTNTYGPVLQVVSAGLASAYFDTTTTVLSTSNNSIASVARPGCLKAASGSTGLNFGPALQAVTVSSAYLMQKARIWVRLS